MSMLPAVPVAVVEVDSAESSSIILGAGSALDFHGTNPESNFFLCTDFALTPLQGLHNILTLLPT